jgi:predicted nuclease with RNAse H fold
MAGLRGTVVVGVDCAIEEARTGLAYGRVRDDGTLELLRVTLGTAGESATATIAGWIDGADAYVVALDAPLGWPAAMARTLDAHRAGEIMAPDADELFRRETDRFVQRELGKLPLEVGADRIARTAHAALALLHEVRKRTVKPLPLGARPGAESCAIEVYPAATLLSRGIAPTGYKGSASTSRAARARILERLSTEVALGVSRDVLIDNSDLLDAMLCALAATDFATGQALTPPDPTLAVKEGWIWFRGRGQKTLF